MNPIDLAIDAVLWIVRRLSVRAKVARLREWQWRESYGRAA